MFIWLGFVVSLHEWMLEEGLQDIEWDSQDMSRVCNHFHWGTLDARACCIRCPLK